MSFYKCSQVFIIKHYLTSSSYLTCQDEFMDNFLIILCQTNWQYLVWRNVSMTQDLFTRLYQTWGKEQMHCWMQWKYQPLNMTMFLFYDFNVIFFDKQNMCQEWVAWPFDHSVAINEWQTVWVCTTVIAEFLVLTLNTKGHHWTWSSYPHDVNPLRTILMLPSIFYPASGHPPRAFDTTYPAKL
jgi:hypothetical protein